MDETQLLTALTAGGAIAGAELVKETTKDAYRGLKTAVASLFGEQTERAIEKLDHVNLDEHGAAKVVREFLAER